MSRGGADGEMDGWWVNEGWMEEQRDAELM